MNTKITLLVLGVALIVVAFALGGVQYFHIYNLYGSSSNRWYFYGAIGVIFLVGIIIAAWGLLRKETPKQTSP